MAIEYPLNYATSISCTVRSFFLAIVVVGYVIAAVTVAAPVSESPAYTLHPGDQFEVNGQQYTVSEIQTSADDNGNILRSASFEHGNETVGFGDSAAITMTLVRGGFPTEVAFTPSVGTVTLGEEEYGAYYPTNNTVQLMTDDVHKQAVSKTNSLKGRFRGMWAAMVLSSLSAILLLGLSYLPVRG